MRNYYLSVLFFVHLVSVNDNWLPTMTSFILIDATFFEGQGSILTVHDGDPVTKDLRGRYGNCKIQIVTVQSVRKALRPKP